MTTVPAQIERPTERPALPNPEPIDTRGIEWRVLTPDTLPEGDDWVYFGLSVKDYESLSLNQAEVLRFIEEAMWRLRYYRGEDDK